VKMSGYFRGVKCNFFFFFFSKLLQVEVELLKIRPLFCLLFYKNFDLGWRTLLYAENCVCIYIYI
jgi:hypothetical protein